MIHAWAVVSALWLDEIASLICDCCLSTPEQKSEIGFSNCWNIRLPRNSGNSSVQDSFEILLWDFCTGVQDIEFTDWLIGFLSCASSLFEQPLLSFLRQFMIHNLIKLHCTVYSVCQVRNAWMCMLLIRGYVHNREEKIVRCFYYAETSRIVLKRQHHFV